MATRAATTGSPRGAAYDLVRPSDVLGTPVHDPVELYAAEATASLRAAGASLGVEITAEERS